MQGGDSFLGKAAMSPYLSTGFNGANATGIGCGGSSAAAKGNIAFSGGNGAAGAVLIEYIRST